MTHPSNSTEIHPGRGVSDVLPFDPAELTHVRVRRADLARMLGVSRQAVSMWIKEGKIRLGADGLIDPKQAVRQLLANSDPGRLRAKVLAPITRDVGTLQRRIKELEAANLDLVKKLDHETSISSQALDALNGFKASVASTVAMLADLNSQAEIDDVLEDLLQAALAKAARHADFMSDPVALASDIADLSEDDDALFDEAQLAADIDSLFADASRAGIHDAEG